jgi:hypothetical protein
LTKNTAAENFLQDGGEMGARIRSYHWDDHPLGRPQEWPQALKTSLRLMLTTRHPGFHLVGTGAFLFLQ